MGWGGSGCASDSQPKWERYLHTVGKCSQVTGQAAGSEQAAALLGCLLLEHVAAMVLLWLSYTSKAKPGSCYPGSLPGTSLFHSCSSFLCRTRMNLLRLTRAWGGFTPTKPNCADSGRHHSITNTLANQMQTRHCQEA